MESVVPRKNKKETSYLAFNALPFDESVIRKSHRVETSVMNNIDCHDVEQIAPERQRKTKKTFSHV